MRRARLVLGALVACLTLLFPAVSAASWLTPSASQALESHPEKVPAEFEEWTAHALDDGTLRVLVTVENRDAVLEDWVADHVVAVHWAQAVPGFLALITPEQLPALLAAPDVRRVVPDHPLTYMLARSAGDSRARGGVWDFDPDAAPLGALTATAPALDADTATGKGVTVAVIDSGIDGTHRDFGGWDCTPSPYTPCESRIKHQVNLQHMIDFGFDVETPTNDLVSGHGTHVAGIVAGNGFYARDDDDDPARYGGDGIPIGIAPQADLLSVKNGDTLWAGLAGLGLDWVLANHADYGIKVVNNSWGCLGGCEYDPESFDSIAIEGLYRAGVSVIFAAGNDGEDPEGDTFSGDSQSPYALSVANYDPASHALAESSSRGAPGTALTDPATWTPDAEGVNGVRRPDLAAPGTDIWSARSLTGGAASLVPRVNVNDTLGGGSSGFVPYAIMSGTSMAAPHVAGAAAVLLSACSKAQPLDIYRSLMAGANPTLLTDTAGSSADPFEVGHGALDVRASLDWMRTHVSQCLLEQPNQAPTAAFTMPAALSAEDSATFSAAASTDADGTIVDYAWNFGDGTTGGGVSPSKVWTWGGTYTVRLTVTDDDGATATTAQVVTVADEPGIGEKRLFATGLDNHKCDASRWELTLKPISGTAPQSVAVVWSDGSRQRVPLSELKSKTAIYRTQQSLEPVMTKAWADVPSTSTAAFTVASGPCH